MYDAREKAALDAASNLIDARQEGRGEGNLVGRVQTYQELLGEQVNDDGELYAKSESELRRMIVDLQARLRLRDA